MESICTFKFFSVCLMKLGGLTLGLYRLVIVISFWYVVPFLSKKWLFFVLFDQCKFEIYFVWHKYCYSCLFSGAINLVNLLQAFHPKTVFISDNKWVSRKQQIVRSSFLIQYAKQYLLMGELSPLTFSVNIDRYVVIPVI
jgi:hypothetical protein